MNTQPACPVCGHPLPADAPVGLCPRCLLDSATVTSAGTGSGTGAATFTGTARPVPGEMFGGYRILRLLGRGGMGEVWEADHVESGRRVALKVMSHRLASETDRKRFLREGRLAAAVSHPNVIYIFGSEEINGVPVIAMELVHAGTLRELVKKRGPLPVAEAVDHMLQVIAGLAAANSAGVLHRDIKPANCFLSSDGTAKVGDFGLSISTLARQESMVTASGSVLGTPSLASPEQLRGEELDVRSDIYSVGATLYHLLTGKLPFHAEELVKLIATVLDSAPVSPAVHRPELPAALCKIILRCLSKDRKARFADYEALAAALQPFSSAAAKPANPGLRFVAGLVDEMIAALPTFAGMVAVGYPVEDYFLTERNLAGTMWMALAVAWALAYYGVCEGLWGAGVGKWLFGLRVANRAGAPPGLPRAIARAGIVSLPIALGTLATLLTYSAAHYAEASAKSAWLGTEWIHPVLLMALFCTIRRHNGFAALHDLATDTRVVVAPVREQRVPVEVPAPAAPSAEATGKVGPYELKAKLFERGAESLWLAHDSALRRDVWIHRQPAGASPVATRRRELSRPTRLRWLNGRRDDTEAWDAYEAPAGRPLVDLLQTPQPWRAVRFWLHDLATEFHTGQQHESPAPRLQPDHVWVRADGQAVVLDFPCPGLAGAAEEANAAATDLASLQGLLHRIAADARHGRDGKGKLTECPPPLPARAFLERLAARAFDSAELLRGNLESLVRQPAVAPANLRANAVLLPGGLALGFGVLVMFMQHHYERRWDAEWGRLFPGKASMQGALVESPTMTEARQKTLRLYLGGEFADVLTNKVFWENPHLGGGMEEHNRKSLTNALVTASLATPAELAAARTAGPAILTELRGVQARDLWVVGLSVVTGMILLGAFASLLVTLTTGQPLLLRVMGLAVVDRHGAPVSRGRALWRWLVGWTPVFLWVSVVFFLMVSPATGTLRTVKVDVVVRAGLYTLLAVLGHLGIALESPWRNWNDKLSGTYVVPR